MGWGQGFDKPWSGLYQQRPEINWANGHTRGLIAACLPGHDTNLVSGIPFPARPGKPIATQGLYGWPTPAAQVTLANDQARFIKLAKSTGITMISLRHIPAAVTPNVVAVRYNGSNAPLREEWGGGNRLAYRYTNSNGTTLVDDDNQIGFAIIDSDNASGQGWIIEAATQDLAAGTARLSILDGVGDYQTATEAVTAGATQVFNDVPTSIEGLQLDVPAFDTRTAMVLLFDRAFGDAELQQYLRGIFAYTFRQQPARRYFVAAGGGAVTGTLSETEEADSLSASGHMVPSGTLAETEADDTSTASGTVTFTGTVAETEANDTLAASGTLKITGTVARTEADDTVSATGIAEYSGSLSETEADDTLSASGTVTSDTITGSAAVTEADDTALVIGLMVPSGTLSVVELDDTASATGTGGEDVDLGRAMVRLMIREMVQPMVQA